MKKVLTILLILVMFLPSIFIKNTKATTIRELREELSRYEQEQKENNEKIQKTEDEIKSINNEISNIYTEIDNITNAIVYANNEINRLNEEIEKKDEATKKLLASLQLTDGDSFYLEYLFGAESISDFIYRYSLTEQITNYNEELINEMNELIEEEEQTKIELNNKQIELNNKQANLQTKIKELTASNVELYELGTDIEDEIENTLEVIQMYLDAGCDEDEEVKVCAGKTLPADTKFWRPMMSGYVTSEYGYRDAIYLGNRLIASAQFHEGIDLSASTGYDTDLYAVANGKIAAIWYDQWGGNQITIHHNINGVTYSSSYAHMSKIFVSVGDIVTKDTIVGKMGMTGSATGPHLHIAISTGLRFNEYSSFASYVARTLSPRTILNLPTYGSWVNRYTMYD